MPTFEKSVFSFHEAEEVFWVDKIEIGVEIESGVFIIGSFVPVDSVDLP